MEELVSGFCENPQRKALYDYVSSKTPICFEKSDSEGWGSQTVDGTTTIFWADSKHQEACLGHELLHAKLKIDGYKQYVTAICRTSKSAGIARLMGAIDNELPHHIFYDEFMALGFSPAEMYRDDDTETYGFVKSGIAELRGDESPMESYFYLLISIIAPGGCLDDYQRGELMTLLEQKAPRRYWKRLNTIRETIRSFAESQSLDAGMTIVAILRSLTGYEPTWISNRIDDFPEGGFFVGEPFTEEDMR